MEKSRAIELLKLAVPIKALTQQEYADFVEAVNMGMDALKAQLFSEDATSDLISRTATIDAVNNAFDKETILTLFVRSIALRAIRDMPSVQPEPTDIDAREAVYNLAEKIGIHQLFALTVELRGEPIQPEPAIPLSWIEKYIEWLKSFDNEFANLEAAHISVMVKKWRDEQHERTD